MITIVRILFGIAAFFIVSFVTVVIAKLICGHDMKNNEERLSSVCWFVSTIGVSVFITLLCISKGIL